MSDTYRKDTPESPTAFNMDNQRSKAPIPRHERINTDETAKSDIKTEFGTEKEETDPHGAEPVRRGFLPWLCFIPALQDPRQYNPRMKWFLTSIVAMGGLVVPLSSGILFPCLMIADDMHTTVLVVNLSIAFGSLAVAITPLWWSHLAEVYGR
jgi:hypothetical protein